VLPARARLWWASDAPEQERSLRLLQHFLAEAEEALLLVAAAVEHRVAVHQVAEVIEGAAAAAAGVRRVAHGVQLCAAVRGLVAVGCVPAIHASTSRVDCTSNMHASISRVIFTSQLHASTARVNSTSQLQRGASRALALQRANAPCRTAAVVTHDVVGVKERDA